MIRNSRAASRVENAAPLNYRVKFVLEERIRSRRLSPRSQLPSQTDLCEEFDVSRRTIREALRELTVAGLIDRNHSTGTFFGAEPHFGSPLMKLADLFEDFYDQVTKVEVRWVSIDEVAGRPPVLRMLSLKPGPRLPAVRRNRYLDDEPFACILNFLPTNIGECLDLSTLRKYPLLWTLEQKLRIRVDSAEQSMRAIVADAEVAEPLSATSASPLMFVERIDLAYCGTPLYLAQSFYRQIAVSPLSG